MSEIAWYYCRASIHCERSNVAKDDKKCRRKKWSRQWQQPHTKKEHSWKKTWQELSFIQATWSHFELGHPLRQSKTRTKITAHEMATYRTKHGQGDGNNLTTRRNTYGRRLGKIFHPSNMAPFWICKGHSLRQSNARTKVTCSTRGRARRYFLHALLPYALASCICMLNLNWSLREVHANLHRL